MVGQELQSEAWNNVRACVATQRLAHAYVIVGSPRGSALRFAEAFLQLLFCSAAEKPCGACSGCRRVAMRSHPDTLWVEPMSKSRQITAEDIRALIHRVSQTAFEGGWKAGVVVSAECMNTASANILLKTLEEPPPRTVLLLLTDSPQALLPTIQSRCQKIVLETGGVGGRDQAWMRPVMALLRDLPPRSGLDAARLAGGLKAVFDAVKGEIADEIEAGISAEDEALDESKIKAVLDARISARLREVQSEVFRVMLDWCRDVLLLATGAGARHLLFPEERDRLATQADLHSAESAMQAVGVVEAMARRLDRNIPPLQVFDEAFRRLVRR